MRALVIILIAATVLCASPIMSAAEQQQTSTNVKSMSVAELEKAGDASRAQKDYAEAVRYFSEAIRKDKKNAKLYNKRGLAELSSGDYVAARNDFVKAAKYNHKYPEAWNDLGVVYYVQKNYPEAAKNFAKAISLDDKRANFHVNLGVTYFAQEQIDLAMHEYTRALELDPDALVRSSNTAMSAQIMDREQRAAQDYMMARVYAKMGEIDRCLKCLEKAKENGYAALNNVYQEEDFSKVRQDARLASIVPPPAPEK
jgi:Flp pilus assembly protein TadD